MMVFALVMIAMGLLFGALGMRTAALRATDCGGWSDDVERRLIHGHRCWPIE